MTQTKKVVAGGAQRLFNCALDLHPADLNPTRLRSLALSALTPDGQRVRREFAQAQRQQREGWLSYVAQVYGQLVARVTTTTLAFTGQRRHVISRDGQIDGLTYFDSREAEEAQCGFAKVLNVPLAWTGAGQETIKRAAFETVFERLAIEITNELVLFFDFSEEISINFRKPRPDCIGMTTTGSLKTGQHLSFAVVRDEDLITVTFHRRG